MSENYIVINGKRLELTPEQIAALGVENPKESKRSPFDRVPRGGQFYAIVRAAVDGGFDACDRVYFAANDCTDKSLLEQRALHEILNRRLWRYSMEHGGESLDWFDKKCGKYYIFFNPAQDCYYVGGTREFNGLGLICFRTEEIAFGAIKEVVKPFIKEHPEFVW